MLIMEIGSRKAEFSVYDSVTYTPPKPLEAGDSDPHFSH